MKIKNLPWAAAHAASVANHNITFALSKVDAAGGLDVEVSRESDCTPEQASAWLRWLRAKSGVEILDMQSFTQHLFDNDGRMRSRTWMLAWGQFVHVWWCRRWLIRSCWGLLQVEQNVGCQLGDHVVLLVICWWRLLTLQKACKVCLV